MHVDLKLMNYELTVLMPPKPGRTEMVVVFNDIYLDSLEPGVVSRQY